MDKETTPPKKRQEGEDDVALAVLAYVPVLCVVTLVSRRHSEFVQFHLSQGLVLAALQLVSLMLFFVPVVGIPLGLVSGLATVTAGVWALGRARARQADSLPLIGRLAARLRL